MLPCYHSEPNHVHYVLVPHYSFYTGAGFIDGRVTAEAIEVAAVAMLVAVLVADRICNTKSVTLASDISRINENNKHVRRI